MNINCSLNQVAIMNECKEIGFMVRHHIFCKDGFCVSVQASNSHFCYPRCTQKYHQAFELLCEVSDDDKDLLESHYDGTICVYVPSVIVEKLILRHGGIDWNKTPRKQK